jgi:hypothetical protein
MWAVRRAIAESEFAQDVRLILCGTAEFPGSLVYANYRTGNMLLNAALLSALHTADAQPENDVIVSGVQGNQYNGLALLTDGAPFDFHLPGNSTPLIEGVPLLPYRAVAQMLKEELQEFRLFIERLKRLSYRAFFHLVPPPPVPDDAFVRSKLPMLPDGQQPEVSPASLRLKLWTVQTAAMQEIVESHGGTLISAPEQSRDDDGFLKKEYWKDAVHANGSYGALQLAQIQSSMSKVRHEEQ